MFHRKKKTPSSRQYDPSVCRPVLLDDGKFEEVMLIRDDADLAVFREEYGITGEIEKIY